MLILNYATGPHPNLRCFRLKARLGFAKSRAKIKTIRELVLFGALPSASSVLPLPGPLRLGPLQGLQRCISFRGVADGKRASSTFKTPPCGFRAKYCRLIDKSTPFLFEYDCPMKPRQLFCSGDTIGFGASGHRICLNP